MLSQKFLFERFLYDTVVFLVGSFDSFSDFLVEDFLLSLLSFGQFGLEVFLFKESLSLTGEFSGVNILEDSVVLVDKLVGLFFSGTFNSEIWISHDGFSTSESLLLSLI